MSLINDMLRDLDKRKAPGHASEQENGPVLIPAVPLKSRPIYHWVLWLILIIGISLLAAFLFKVYSAYDSRVQQSITETQVAESVMQPQQAGPAIIDTAKTQVDASLRQAPVAVQSIVIRDIDPGVRLEIKLSEVVDHRVIKKNAQEIFIQLPNTQLTDLLPSIAAYPLINALDVASEMGSLQLKVLLARQATFQTYILKKSSYALLVIDLLASKTAADTETGSGMSSNEVVPATPQALAQQSATTYLSQGHALSKLQEPDSSIEPASNKPSVFAKTVREKTLPELDKAASQQALSAFRFGKVEAAIAQLNNLIVKHPQAQLSRETLIVILMKQQRFTEAQREIDSALKVAPGKATLVKLQARLFMATNDHAAALGLLKSRKNDNLNDLDYLSLLASLSQHQGEHANAVSLYRELLKGDPNRANWWVGQAISLEAIGLKREALMAYLQARRIPKIDARLKQYADERIRALN